MSLQKIPSNPGVYKDDTLISAEGFYVDADKIRFVRGLPQTFGGWELISSVAMTGKCRGLVSWADNSLVKWIGAGTHTNLYAFTDSLPYDITPVITRVQAHSISFATTIGSAVVTLTGWTHGMAVGQAFAFANAQTATIGGITVDTAAATTSVPSPWFTVLTVASATSITYTAASVATSTAGPTAITVDYRIYLAPGLENGIGALGYSTGVYSGPSTYSSPATGATYPRTWSLCPYGQNLLANPRGGALYEWKPAVSATELVTNGTFTGSATGWTLGTGWAYGTNNVTATNASASLSQSITTTANAFNLVSLNISAYTGGSAVVGFNGVTLNVSGLTSTGVRKFTFWSAGATGTFAMTGISASMTVDDISVQQLLTAEVVPNAPATNTCMLVTPEGFVMVFGTVSGTSGNFDPLLIRWSTIGTTTNGQQVWSPSSSNLSRSVRLLAGSRIVGAKIANNEVLVWTDKALYALTYANNSSIVYSTRLVGTNCGLIGPNAAAVHGGTAYWTTPAGENYMYAGGAPTPIKSGISADVSENIALVQQDKIFASPIGKFNDVITLYPDSRDGAECSRYSLLDTMEQGPPLIGTSPGVVGVFVPGTFDRTAMIDAGVHPYPIAADSAGYLYYHEKGNTANGGTLTWFLETGAAQIGNGDTLFSMDTFVPDFASFQGGCTLTAYAYKWPQATPTTHGPFNLTSATETVGLLSDAPTGRQIALRFDGSSSPAEARFGRNMMEITDTGMEQ